MSFDSELFENMKKSSAYFELTKICDEYDYWVSLCYYDAKSDKLVLTLRNSVSDKYFTGGDIFELVGESGIPVYEYKVKLNVSTFIGYDGGQCNGAPPSSIEVNHPNFEDLRDYANELAKATNLAKKLQDFIETCSLNTYYNNFDLYVKYAKELAEEELGI